MENLNHTDGQKIYSSEYNEPMNFDPEGFNDFDPEGFVHSNENDFDPEGFDPEGFEEGPDSLFGLGKRGREIRALRHANKIARIKKRQESRMARLEAKRYRHEHSNDDLNNQAQTGEDPNGDPTTDPNTSPIAPLDNNELVYNQPKSPTPLVDQLNNYPDTETLAGQNDVSEDQYLEDTISPYSGMLEEYIGANGYQTSPSGNLAENATRFMLIHNKEKLRRQKKQAHKLRNEGMTDDEIYMHLKHPDEIKEDLIKEHSEKFGDGFDSFFPGVFGAIEALGKKGIGAIKQAQQNKINAAKDQATQVATLQANLNNEKAKNSQGVKKYAPYIIGAIVVVALVLTFLYIKKKK